jgi:branched-chain amino acid aminotransferase
MYVWLNGKFVERGSAKISAFDAGFQHGVGLFETMLARNGRVFRLERHLQRLADSAAALSLATELRLEPLGQAVQHALDRNEMLEARIRLTITGGDLNLLQSGSRSTVDPTILIVAQPPTNYPENFFTEGVSATIADGRLNPLDPHAGHKTLSYWPRIAALQKAGASGAGEALWFTVSNHLVGGSVSNIVLVKDGSLLTPPARGQEAPGALASPVLPGITRQTIIELAGDRGIDVHARLLTIDDLLGADEVFLTNSSWGVLPVVRVEKQEIAGGRVGNLTQQLHADWLELVRRETAGAEFDKPD